MRQKQEKNKKFELNKSTIAALNGLELSAAKGGWFDYKTDETWCQQEVKDHLSNDESCV